MSKLLSFFSLLLLLVSCSAPQEEDNALYVGTSADNPPFEFVQNGQIVGFDIDLINEIANKLGKKIIIKNMSFQSLVPAVTNSDVQIVIAGISATERRAENMDFSIPYLSFAMSVITKDSFKIDSIEQLAGKIIGVQLGSTWHNKATDIASDVANVKIRALANNLLLINELILGNIDAIIAESSQFGRFEKLNKQLNKFTIPSSECLFAIAFTKDSSLKEDVNKIILELKATGYLDLLFQKWFNQSR
jgi:polar amino acid transport system substrate-binding protein